MELSETAETLLTSQILLGQFFFFDMVKKCNTDANTNWDKLREHSDVTATTLTDASAIERG